MDTVAKRLAWAINLRKIESAAQAGRLVGIPESTMRTYLLGTRTPGLEQCERIGAALRVNPRWIWKGEGTPDTPDGHGRAISNIAKIEPIPLTGKARRLTLYSAALAGPWGQFMLAAEKVGTVSAPPNLADVDDAYAVHIVGESMEPRYRAGEIVYVHPHTPVRRNDYVVVQFHPDNDGAAIMGMVKLLVSLTEADVVMTQHNPPMEIRLPRERVKSVHRVVGSSEG
jgi:phage repressor protein C with HTH and peptisase S24 domain